jgi:hypothetical protein
VSGIKYHLLRDSCWCGRDITTENINGTSSSIFRARELKLAIYEMKPKKCPTKFENFRSNLYFDRAFSRQFLNVISSCALWIFSGMTHFQIKNANTAVYCDLRALPIYYTALYIIEIVVGDCPLLLLLHATIVS